MATQVPPPGYRPPPPVPTAPATIRLSSTRRRVRIFTALFAIFFAIYMLQLINIQIIQGPKYAQRAENTRLQTIKLPAIRGEITDVNGNTLVMSVKARNVVVDQTLVKDPKAAAKKLSPLLGIPVDTLTERLTGKRRFNYVAYKITPALWKKVSALEIPGISREPTTLRVYPQGSLAASILGYTGREGHGFSGMELQFDKLLGGTDGNQNVEMVNGAQIPTGPQSGTEPVDGSSIRLTIDQTIQAIAEHALAKRVKEEHALGGDVVVLDPKTFNILAMATYPTFDPNHPEKTTDRQKRNTAVTDAFEPGSTSKVMTMAAVLEEGALKPTSKMIIPPSIKRGGARFKDHNEHGTLHLTLNGVLAQSSNIGSIMASEKIGQDKFLEYLKKFGIGQGTGLKFPGESGGILPNPNNPNAWSDTTFPTLAFGQGVSVTALQVASVYATIANNGVRLTPKIVAGVTDNTGNFTPTAPSAGVRVVSSTTAKTVRNMLESVVSAEGTAPIAQIPGYRVAGKTGTANRVKDKGGYSGYTASFVGMAPAENPALVVAVMIHTKGGLHFGSLLSGPVFREVMMYALAAQKVPPSVKRRPSIPVKW